MLVSYIHVFTVYIHDISIMVKFLKCLTAYSIIVLTVVFSRRLGKKGERDMYKIKIKVNESKINIFFTMNKQDT